MKKWSGRTIQSKLIIIFAAIIILFNIVTISIYFSSSQLTRQYQNNLESLLQLNLISKTATELSDATNSYVWERNERDLSTYYDARVSLKEQVEALSQGTTSVPYKNYMNMVDALIDESELAIGFVLKDDMERYTAHVNEVQNTSNYIQEATLELLDSNVTEYQTLYADMEKRKQSFAFFTVFLLITSIFVGAFIAFRFGQGINRPVRQLSDAAKEVAKGKFDGEPVTIKSRDELEILGESFNTMRASIQSLIKEIKDQSKQDMLMKELELKHLQNQIHPHFLFNTLNTVAKMAYLEEASSTSKLIESLASMMRHSLGDLKKSVDLQDELKMVADYVAIQQMRFMERIECHISGIDENLHIKIPRLTLQPLVENAFIHGLESLEEGGKVEVNITETTHTVIIEVADNGVGMTNEQLAALLKEEPSSHVGHVTGIGLRNVIKRLQLFYKKDEIIDIESEEKKGTSIRIHVPKQNKGEVA